MAWTFPKVAFSGSMVQKCQFLDFFVKQNCGSILLACFILSIMSCIIDTEMSWNEIISVGIHFLYMCACLYFQVPEHLCKPSA